MDEKATSCGRFVHYRGGVYGSYSCLQGSYLAKETARSDTKFKQSALTIYSDSQSAIYLENNLIFHAKTKHIDVQYHFVRDMVKENKVKLEEVETLVNIIDALTKPVSTKKFRWCLDSMGLSTPSN